MTSPGDGPDHKSGVSTRCRDNASVGVRFRDRFSFEADCVHYAVELPVLGLTARVNEAVAWIRDSELVRSWKSSPPATGDLRQPVQGSLNAR